MYCAGICAAIAQLGERQTEDLKVPGSIPGRGNKVLFIFIPSMTASECFHNGFVYQSCANRTILEVPKMGFPLFISVHILVL